MTIVSELWRYPVKSLGGERLESVVVEVDGVRGDHVWAVVDRATGHVASAKRSKLWGELLRCRARLVDDVDLTDPSALEITLPDGAVLRGDDPRTVAALSELTGREVVLRSPAEASRTMEMEWVAESRIGMEAAVETSSARAEQDAGSDVPVGAVPTGGANDRFYDLAHLHVLTTSSLNALAPGSAGSVVRRYRPNVLVGGPDWDAGWIEDAWVDGRVRIGAVEIGVQTPTGRCVMVNLAHQGLPADRGTLRALAAAHRVPVGYGTADLPSLGVYAEVVTAGAICVGDVVEQVPADALT
ncbi:MOSC domain-containing protein [Prescottella subtropica]|uniref:MOSC domain-containing protein n=1 Tax=Prescottella subtropica TaxID=2545757 RepID=UPI0010F4919B|nr:MOSC N-terminal beta barrel domain-containing protein [Prescottella subtropica]